MINSGGYDHKPTNLVTVEPTFVQKEPILVMLANTGNFLAKLSFWVKNGNFWSKCQLLVKMVVFFEFLDFWVLL